MKIIQTKMRFQVIEMTPEFAQELLDKNHPNNRTPKESRIRQYERDMVADMWQLNWQAIAQDEDGYLVDGQNRCAACIRAGVNIPVVFCTGAPRKAILGADCGITRSVADASKIMGKPLPHGAIGFSSVARSMAAGISKQRNQMTIQETLAFIKDHQQALDFAFECMSKNTRLLTQAPVRAVIARAWYKRNSRTRTREFCEVFLSGLPGNVKTDASAIRLRNWLLETMGSRRGGNRPNRRTIYAKTATALFHFLDYRSVEALRETSEELFPLSSDPEPDDVHPESNGRLMAV